MYNDDDFYHQYYLYLIEKSVSNAHNKMLDLFDYDYRGNDDYVLELGCGNLERGSEYSSSVGYSIEKYVGIDLNLKLDPKLPKEDFHKDVVGDYRDKDLILLLAKELQPKTFVSLFSTEITAPYQENYEYYKFLFNEIPSLNRGLVAGFYYWNKKDENPVIETGDIMSFQTLEPLEDVLNEVFTETRHMIHVPSTMFGSDVIEVWKIFHRK